MYLAKYTIQDAPWIQAAATLVFPADAGRRNGGVWQSRLRALARTFDTVPDQAASLRVHLGERLEATLFFVAPARHAEPLRAALGRFTQLGVLAEGEVRYPSEQREHDRLLSFPRWRCRVTLPQMSRAAAWFAFDFRVQPFLHELFAEARAQAHELSYHVNVERITPHPDWKRQAARNALKVEQLTAVPSALDQLQHDLADKLDRATHVSEELLGVETPSAREWLTDALLGRFRDQFGKYVNPEFTFDDAGFESSIDVTRHRIFFEPLRVDEVCSAAITDDERIELLTWTPPIELSDLLVHDTGEAEAGLSPLDYSGMPQSYEGTDGFFFISYKRDDLDAIKGMLNQLSAGGHRIWYDKGILAGAEWDAMIEERIRRCRSVLLFVSAKAVKSKYVRREVKFADTLNKPIVAIQLEPNVELGDGMAMLLNQYHYVDARSTSVVADLERAARSWRVS